MARMIPSEIASTASLSEKLVFEQLRNGPKDWSILHSIDVPVPGHNPREIDFLIGIPDRAVICLEVKGGQFQVSDGLWHRQGDERVENPFDQAQNAMFALKNYIPEALHGDNGLRSVLLDHAVVFTDAEWPAGVKRPPARQFYDSHSVKEPGGLIRRLADFATIVSKRRSGRRPTPAMLSRLHSLFYPDFTMQYGWVWGPYLHRIDRELLEFTSEQYHALRMVHNSDGSIRNERVLFQGGAGTGKTMLALQLARQRHGAGNRVALVCHSRILGQWLRRQLEPEVADVGMVLEALSRAALEPRSVREHYSQQLQDAIQQQDDGKINTILFDKGWSLAETLEKDDRKWDYLIVDELQYFDDPMDFIFLDMALKGGLANGRWAMFGDFAYQDVLKEKRHEPYYDDNGLPARSGHVDPDSHLALLCNLKGPGSQWAKAIPLEINCRNTRSIAKAAGRVVDNNAVEVHPSRVEGPDVVHRYWGDDDVFDVLSQELQRLHNEGVDADRVTVVVDIDADVDLFNKRELDPWILISPIQSHFDPPGNSPLTPVNIYSSIGFAGMEQDVVVVVSTVKDDKAEHPDAADAARYTFTRDMYLGMTRAKGGLIVIAHQSMQKWVEP